jgi:hypothetical protein
MATAIIISAVVALACLQVISGDAAVGIIGSVAGFWFGQFAPTPTA